MIDRSALSESFIIRAGRALFTVSGAEIKAYQVRSWFQAWAVVAGSHDPAFIGAEMR